jgi:NADPH-dependent 2,4-dienoyl-CoA reductase/sulfur reductase-like enzyme
MKDIVVVGAGVAGLAAARELSAAARVTVVDRLPACGGVLAFDHAPVRELERCARAAGVVFALGATATRWTGERLLIASPDAIRWLRADHLVYAGGSRPSTPAELQLTGLARLAGILPAPVAVHLLEAGVRIGRNVIVIGAGDWAARARAELAHHGIRVTSVTMPDEDPEDGADQWVDERYEAWMPVAAWGGGRVAELLVERHGVTRRLLCDALVLAARLRPLRNVDGAVDDNSSATYIQHAAQRATVEEVVVHACEAAKAVLNQCGGD